MRILYQQFLHLTVPTPRYIIPPSYFFPQGVKIDKIMVPVAETDSLMAVVCLRAMMGAALDRASSRMQSTRASTKFSLASVSLCSRLGEDDKNIRFHSKKILCLTVLYQPFNIE